ncbi:MAG: M28 family metallopeptidase [Acidobacteriota bacterium]
MPAYLWKAALSIGLTGLMLSCAAGDPVETARQSITVNEVKAWTQTLAGDDFQGRAPSSPGEERTIAFLRDEFQKLGLQPGNGGDFYQPVPLVDITVQGSPTLEVTGKGEALQFAYGPEAVFWTKRVVESVGLEDSELVFAGYGVVAPEYGWNDYQGLDAAGKTVVLLVNDPGYGSGDESLFNGRAMIIHERDPAGYGWDTVRNSWTGPQFDLVRQDDNMSRLAVEGWLTLEAARRLLERAGHDLDALQQQALSKDFEAVPLGLSASLSLTNNLRRSNSNNVLAVLPGSQDSEEYVVFMAHWDHFGLDESLPGDQIYNGALDNATGVAGLLALAKAFAGLPEPPSRSVLFLAVTAEEQGLLGSAYYAANPVYPTRRTVAAINMDGLNILGPMKDITVIGYGNSDLDDYLDEAARQDGRTVRGDPEPEKGYYYRSDHFSFAKVGIPALYTDAGIDHVEHGEEWTRQKREEYIANNYHRVSDEYDPSWDMSGAVDDLRILFSVGYRIANSSDYPNWREGTEFKATRDADMEGR